MRRLQAVVAVHDPRRPLTRCVRSILADRDALAADGVELVVRVVVHNTPLAGIQAGLDPRLADAVRWSELHDGVRSAAGPFNLGLDEADADAVTTVGSDDLLEPGALPAWWRRYEQARADAVVAALRTSAGVVSTPYLRPRRRLLLDPVADGLAYRTAPLGLLRLDTLRRIGFRYTTGGHLNGEDIEPGLRLWFRGGRITYPYGAPCYRVLDDMGEHRATATLGPLARELGALGTLPDQEWLRAAAAREREAVAVKLARTQLQEGLLRRVAAARAGAPDAWGPDDGAHAGRVLAWLAELSGNDLAALAPAERDLVLGAAAAGTPDELATAADRARGGPAWRRVLPWRPGAVLDPCARPRTFLRGQAARRAGVFDHPAPPAGWLERACLPGPGTG